MTTSILRLGCAAGVLLAWVALCLAIWLRERRKQAQARRAAAGLMPSADGLPPLLLAYASQTGFAEELAWHTARLIHTAGEPVQVLALNDITAQTLQRAERALFIVSTYGEGDAPDNAALFVGRLMQQAQALGHLHYGLLALGDRQYANFCGFGRALDGWLQHSAAQRLFDPVEVDNAAPPALQAWQQALVRVASVGDLPDWEAPAYEGWTLAARRLLNPGSLGQPVYWLELAPPAGSTPQWESGDLVQLACPADPDHPREYSIASLPGDGHIALLVRLQLRSDGSPGWASHWLCHSLQPGDTAPLRLRAHSAFRLGANAARPLILIGNGTGLAGLRGHIRAREATGAGPNWLVFGERQAAHDVLLGEDIRRWQDAGVLTRTDLAFSRDQTERLYVQDRLREVGDSVLDWLSAGAAIYVCGSLEGMAGGVDAALRQIAGDPAIDRLAQQGRYRRDVY
jgi:sulfite reductase (NADPH) flavoprotein alpha-component